MDNYKFNIGPMLNAYPDSMGGNLSYIVRFLKNDKIKDAFQSFYILPSVFNTDLDRGFSVIDYELNQVLAKKSDFDAMKELGIAFKFDFILNHASVLSPQFQDLLNRGEESIYKDFFINWNSFWASKGQMTSAGYIEPEKEFLDKMFFRKPGLPILSVRMPDGSEVPYWNTFYQKVYYTIPEVQDLIKTFNVQYSLAEYMIQQVNALLKRGQNLKELDLGHFNDYKAPFIELLEKEQKYLGQMDLNIKEPLVWEFYEDTLKKLASYGASIVRLDAFAYASKEPGASNFFNEPGTWDLLEKVNQIANKYKLALLPEIHSKYEDKTHEKVSEKGYMIYDFFLPGLIIDALENQKSENLVQWGQEIIEKEFKTVNMLGCHDGIPLLDLKGLLSDEEIEELIETVVSRGGYVKDLHGKKNMYYQVNATYYSALGEDVNKLLLARAIQLFMPGKPQIWYLDFFAGKNNYRAVEEAGPGGHKEINRTNLSWDEVVQGLESELVQRQLKLIRFRNLFPAFTTEANIEIVSKGTHEFKIYWKTDNAEASLHVDLLQTRFEIVAQKDEQMIDWEKI
jgi:sucrose phosphorylase